ncbi:hypothetical protein ANN_17780 [Periplaneta americana]|uniref:Uncharacterized protein n=1 Tax=Periplaneta americana TaxID=6978 RepID=A0ABQ8STX5_PERAM|nr:hypothetical protein ANN_17780 [Periplaneta americana]
MSDTTRLSPKFSTKHVCTIRVNDKCTVTSAHYRDLLVQHVIPALQERNCDHIIIFICVAFKIPDLNPGDFWLWEYLKDRVYQGHIRSLSDLKVEKPKNTKYLDPVEQEYYSLVKTTAISDEEEGEEEEEEEEEKEEEEEEDQSKDQIQRTVRLIDVREHTPLDSEDQHSVLCDLPTPRGGRMVAPSVRRINTAYYATYQH